MRTAQPTGPYLIAGFSSGGVVAYEMAQQLAAAGEQVALLALLDTYRAAGDDGQALAATNLAGCCAAGRICGRFQELAYFCALHPLASSDGLRELRDDRRGSSLGALELPAPAL